MMRAQMEILQLAVMIITVTVSARTGLRLDLSMMEVNFDGSSNAGSRWTLPLNVRQNNTKIEFFPSLPSPTCAIGSCNRNDTCAKRLHMGECVEILSADRTSDCAFLILTSRRKQRPRGGDYESQSTRFIIKITDCLQTISL